MQQTNTRIADYAIPYVAETEHLLLCEVINNPETLTEVQRIVTRNMFFLMDTAKIWDVIMEKYNAHEHIDLSTIYPKVERDYFTRNILSLTNKAETSLLGVLSHASALRDLYVKRLAYYNAVRTLNMIREGATVENVLDNNKSLQETLESQLHEDTTKSLTSVINEVAADLEKGVSTHIRSGIPQLDYLTYGGFTEGNLVILAARPSVGKTTLAMQMAMSASNSGKKVCVFSLEMTSKELAQRILIATGKITPYAISTREIEWASFEEAVRACSTDNLSINDKSHTIEDIASKITILHQEGRCDIAFVDYLGLISLDSSGKMTLAQQISEITRRLKQTAKSCGIPIVLLCQLNRSSASEKRSPQLFDLRDSGAIEQDADCVLMLERPSGEDKTEGNYIDMWVRKNRGGKAGEICLHLQGDDNYSNFRTI